MNEKMWMLVILVEMLICALASGVFVALYFPVKQKVDIGWHLFRTSALFGLLFLMTITFQFWEPPLWFAIGAQVVIVGATACELTYRVVLLVHYRRIARQRALDELAQRRQAAADASAVDQHRAFRDE